MSEACWVERIDVARAEGAVFDEAGRLQHGEVLGNGGARDGEQACEVGDGGGRRGDRFEDLAAGGIGERGDPWRGEGWGGGRGSSVSFHLR